MKPKTMILMVVAVVCGLGASYMTSRLLAEREDQKQEAPTVIVQQVPKVSILVARKMIAVNSTMKNPKDYFMEKAVVQEDAPKDAVRSWDGLAGKTMRRSLRAGDHLLPDDVQDGAPTLAVPPGMRAVGLRVTVDAIAAGFASLPGSRVHIYFNMRRGTVEQSFSMRLLQNVLVLAADTTDGTGEGARAIPASVVTLALTPDDTQRVSLASEHGTLRLVLRERLDDGKEPDKVMTLDDVIKNGNGEQKPEVVADAAVPPVVEPIEAPKAQEEPAVPVSPRRKHVVWFRSGDKQWREVYELDEHGNVIHDDVQRFEAPQNPAPPPAAQGIPDALPGQPPQNVPAQGGQKKE